MMERFKLLEADDIEVKVKQVKSNGAALLLYKTSRTDMDKLDEALGPENWSCDYKEIKGNLYCGISIYVDGRWITKWDCGIESRSDGEGNEKKGEASDAFKRAGFKVGIGRELYTGPFIWVPASKVDITSAGGRSRTFDHFSVEKIRYDEDRRIDALSIWNDTKNCRAFVWQREKDR